MEATATAMPMKMAARDAGMSERTFYRYKAAGKPIPPPQFMAHVEDYHRSLDPFARLDAKSAVRRGNLRSPAPWKPAHLAPFADLRA